MDSPDLAGTKDSPDSVGLGVPPAVGVGGDPAAAKEGNHSRTSSPPRRWRAALQCTPLTKSSAAWMEGKDCALVAVSVAGGTCGAILVASTAGASHCNVAGGIDDEAVAWAEAALATIHTALETDGLRQDIRLPRREIRDRSHFGSLGSRSDRQPTLKRTRQGAHHPPRSQDQRPATSKKGTFDVWAYSSVPVLCC